MTDREQERTERITERITGRIVIGLGIVVTLAIFIGGPLWTRANQLAARPASVVGVVTSQSGTALPHISVQVYDWRNHQWSATDAKETDASGRYRFAGLPAGRLTVAFEDDSGVGYLSAWYGGSITDRNIRHITVAPGATGRMNVQLILGGAIIGRTTITDPARGLSGATQFSVAAYPLIPDGAGGFSRVVDTTEIDSLGPTRDGNWRIQDLPTGSYVLRVLDDSDDGPSDAAIASQWIGGPPVGGDWRDARVFTVTAGDSYSAPPTHVEFSTAHPSPTIVITVVDSSGDPVRGAAVGLAPVADSDYSFQSGHGGSPFTNAAGQVSLYRVVTGDYTLTVGHVGYATVVEPLRDHTDAPGDAVRVTVTLTT